MESKTETIVSGHPDKVETMEHPPHLDVATLMKEKNAFFVHMFQVTDTFSFLSKINKALDTSKLSIADKMDIVYGVSPTLSASTLRPKTIDSTFHGGFGVIFSHGKVLHAARGDDATITLSRQEKHVYGGYRNEKDDIDAAIDRNHAGGKGLGGYNELLLKNPEVAGGFMKLENYQKRITYEVSENIYYNGEKEAIKIGIVDFSNPIDRFGRPTGENYDKPFSVLLEMRKRGKVFFMDEANQVYIINDIDEKTRKVEFTAVPITPAQMADSYGKERTNPYLKKEMTDRLEESLKEKGMTLH